MGFVYHTGEPAPGSSPRLVAGAALPRAYGLQGCLPSCMPAAADSYLASRVVLHIFRYTYVKHGKTAEMRLVVLHVSSLAHFGFSHVWR